MFQHRLSVAPMIDWTNRHCRYFHRLFSAQAVLYSEMITTGAILHGPRNNLLAFDKSERPVALQLGGCDPLALAKCAQFAAETGYDEINLNIGCPSDRVQSGRFGACLMAEPTLVADCVAKMRAAVPLPITVKTRIGIDDLDSYESLVHFIATVANAGCKTFIIHARKAWLQGLSPKENREIPPLRYEIVNQVKQDFPLLEIVINGGITTAQQALEHLALLDGVMIGRAIYHNPFLLAEISKKVYNNVTVLPSRISILERYLPYIQQQLEMGVRLGTLIRPMLGLFQAKPGARAWRRYLSEHSHKPNAGIEVVKGAMEFIF